jgi:hypothetical protein
MKDLFIAILLVAFSSVSYPQNPTYNLVAENFSLGDSLTVHDMIKFDIYVTHTNPPMIYEYAGGQYMFNFNTAVTSSSIEVKIVGNSDLPVELKPRGPSISGSQIRLGVNAFPGAGLGYIMTGNGPQGTYICQVRLRNLGGTFNNVPLNLQWRDLPSSNPVTRLFAYVGTTNTDITTPATHSIQGGNVLNGITVGVRVLMEGMYNNLFNLLNRKDSVRVYLAEINAPYNKVDSAVRDVDSVSFTGEFYFMSAPSGTYYLVVKHFNCLETWSKAGGIAVTQGGIFSYDFTTSASQAYGDNLKPKGTKYCMWSGDVDQDGIIDGTDLAAIDNAAYNFTAGYNIPEDLNGDNLVDGVDFLIGDNNRTFHYVISP